MPTQTLLMVGGSIGAVWLSDTGELANDTWSLRPRRDRPHPASNPFMAYDRARAETLMFGGFDEAASTEVDETWLFDGTNWEQAAAAPATRPPTRKFGAIAYDEARDRIVLYGGWVRASNTCLSDTWEWNGASRTWTERLPAHEPTQRCRGRMTYGPIAKRVVMFGGSIDFSTPSVPDLWEWDGTDWTQRTTNAGPTAQGFELDRSSNRFLAFGGDETWELDGATWTRLYPAHSPPKRGGHTFTYDAARGRIVMSHGIDPPTSSIPMSDAWDGPQRITSNCADVAPVDRREPTECRGWRQAPRSRSRC